MTSVIRQAIIMILDSNNGEISGTEELAIALQAPKPWVVKCARILQHDEELTIIPSNGGRGHKSVYKRNRNQPGLARRVRKSQ